MGRSVVSQVMGQIDRKEQKGKFEHARLRATNEAGQVPTMYVPPPPALPTSDSYDDAVELDPELRYTFQRNFQFLRQVFSIDTVLKPLPPPLASSVARNYYFFTRIFTQFFDPNGVKNAQKSMGIGHEERRRNVR